MTWQDSLRELDTRLARGEIGAAEYRKTRDEILAEASSGAERREDLWAAAAQPAASDRTTSDSSTNGRATADTADPGETTLVVDVPAESETTQVVGANQVQAAAGPARSPLPPTPALPVAPPVGERAGAPMPPAGGPARFQSVPIHGQEVFAEAGPGHRRLLPKILVSLLVLAVVGAGVWWFGLREDSQPNPAEPAPTSQPTSAPQPPSTDEIADLLPELPGAANPANGTMPLDRARELKLFAPAYETLLADNGAREVVYRGAAEDGVGYLLLVSPIPPTNGADGVVVLTSEHLHSVGFTPTEPVIPGGPDVISRTDQYLRSLISVYASGDVWVQLHVSVAPDGDEAALRAAFQRALESLTDRLPAN